MRIKLTRARWLIILICLCCNVAHAQQSREHVINNSEYVEQMYDRDKENLPYDKVVGLATEIIQYRKQYSKETIAKAYVLLAEVAHNKGDAARSFQFAVDGLTYKPLPTEIQLNLEIKLAAGYFAKGMYHNVLHFVEQVLTTAKEQHITQYYLLALAYRAMANALIGEEDKAADDLITVQQLIEKNRQYAEQFDLLKVIAISYHYLGDYNTAMQMHEKLLKLHFNLKKTNGIEETYYNLALAYLKLERFDDAYNAFWETKKIAEEKKWPIKRAYAELGIGQVHLQQNEYQQAYLTLIEAENSFKGQNLNKPYLSTLIALAKASFATDRLVFANQLLTIAEELMQIAELTKDQTELYKLLAHKYQAQGNTTQAYQLLTKYIETEQQIFQSNNAIIKSKVTVIPSKEQNKKIALGIAQSYQEHSEFSEQIAQQKQIILLLATASLIMGAMIIAQWFVYRSKIQKHIYGQFERPNYTIANPTQTKSIYHRAFKKARKYEYSLTLGYLTITNWQDLTFTFNKKIIAEVNRTIATIINEHIGEFDQAGQINQGEYLIIYPHQSSHDANANFEKLLDALKVRFFANLGEFSVNLRYSIDSPCIQDIDPYIFLSRLSDVS